MFHQLARILGVPPSHRWDEQGFFQKISALPGKICLSFWQMTFQAWLGWRHQTPQRGAVRDEFCRAPPIYLCWWIKVKRERIIREGQPVCSVPSKLVPSHLLHLTFLVLLPVSLHGTEFRGVKGIAPDGVIRKKRARTQYLGPCFWTLWSSQPHPRGGC